MTNRPTISPEVVSQIAEAAPSRVRKRLDRNPTAAAQWSWIKSNGQWTISAGEETVSLSVNENDQVTSPDSVSCTCLLAPKCFHALASVTSLAYCELSGDTGENIDEETNTTEDDESTANLIEVSDAMRAVAHQTLIAVESVLTTGARSAGVVLQSSLLRAAHQCRAEVLIHLANATIRFAEGIQRLRAGDDHTDSPQIRRDAVAAIQYSRLILDRKELSPSEVGYLRRPYHPVQLSRLQGIVAEPILTLSGYAGVCVHLEGDDGKLYQLVDLRPGDASLVRQAYLGGIDIGSTTATAQQLSRASVDVQNLTASPDGRLGKGTKTRWAIRSERAEFTSDRFSKSIDQQIETVFAEYQSAVDGSGSELISCEGTILGARGSCVLLAADGIDQPIQLGIAIDSDQLEFRRNLELLARCPGMRVRVVGRLRVQAAGRIDALCIEPISAETENPATSGNTETTENDESLPPRLDLPQSFGGRCQLGFDKLQRHHVSDVERFAVEVDFDGELLTADSSLTPGELSVVELFPGLENRMTTMVLGGRGSIAAIGSAAHRRDRARLEQRIQPFAAKLLDTIATARFKDVGIATAIAATEKYCDVARAEHQFECWRRFVTSGGEESH